MSIDEFRSLFMSLENFEGSYVDFYCKVKTEESSGEIKISSLLQREAYGLKSTITIGKGEEYTAIIGFNQTEDLVFMNVYQFGSLIAAYELLDFYLEFPVDGKKIHRNWTPSDQVYYPSDSENTAELSIRERDFHKKVKDVIFLHTGKHIKIWALAFDENSEKVKERLHGEIATNLKLKRYFFEGRINPQDGDIPTIKTERGKISISYQAFIGAPLIMTFYNFDELLLSDLYIEIEGIVIQPKDLTPDNTTEWHRI